MKSEKLLEGHYVYVLTALVGRPMTINQIYELVEKDNFTPFICNHYSVRRIIIALSNMGCVSKESFPAMESGKTFHEYRITLKGARAVKNALVSTKIIQDRLERSLTYRKEVSGGLDQVTGEVRSANCPAST